LTILAQGGRVVDYFSPSLASTTHPMTSVQNMTPGKRDLLVRIPAEIRRITSDRKLMSEIEILAASLSLKS
jgi:hypothetical protein